jgi:hypothetical protein
VASTSIGTAGADTRVGTRKPDTMFGLAGDDRLRGDRGRDCIDGGMGSDQLFGRRGADLLFGGAGADLIDGEDGVDRLGGVAATKRPTRGDILSGDAGAGPASTARSSIVPTRSPRIASACAAAERLVCPYAFIVECQGRRAYGRPPATGEGTCDGCSS